MLILYAAGNDGDTSECGEHTLGDKATSKNGLAVGASETGRWGREADPDYVAYFRYESPLASPSQLG